LEGLAMEDVGIFCDHLVYFVTIGCTYVMVIWYIFSPYVVPRKIWQPWLHWPVFFLSYLSFMNHVECINRVFEADASSFFMTIGDSHCLNKTISLRLLSIGRKSGELCLFGKSL
jgi:hypothetical protein